MKYLIYVLHLIFVFVSANAQAALYRQFKNVNYDDQYTNIESFVLGRTCYSLKASPLNLDCNPAFLAGKERRTLNLNLNVDNNIEEVYGYSRDLKNHRSDKLINRILKEDRPLTANEMSSVWWQYDWWAISYIPARLALATVMTNPAYPKITTHLSLQRELSAKTGFFVEEDTKFRVGANLRYVRNDQLRDEFALLDVLSGNSDVKVRDKDIVYFEPAMTYELSAAWDSQISVVLTHLALYESEDDVPDVARPEIGYSTTPDYFDRKFRTSLHYTARPDTSSVSDRFRFGGIYSYDPDSSLSFTLAGDEYGVGLMGRIDSLVLGIGFKSEMFHLDGKEVGRSTTTLMQGGLTF